MSPPVRASSPRRNRVRGYGREGHVATVAELLAGSPFVGYGYAYPHKTAYRTLERPRALARVWASEDHDHLFLYAHVPFCAVRCGFCNLFTQRSPLDELVEAWLAALERQLDAVHEAIPAARFARWALGGGTPTLLSAAQLARVFELIEARWPLDFARTPGSVETSPETCTDDRLAVLEGRGSERISIGVQSFLAEELAALGRPQGAALAEAALDRIRARRFAVLNVDLIYGIAGQTPASLLESIDRALGWAPEQLYLYPLYQRPLTGLGRKPRSWADQRIACSRAGRRRLLEAGYEQVSMRMFARPQPDDAREPAPVYCCQADGMVGLGVGARSYTRALHYSDAWAVGSASVREIIGEWIRRSRAQLGRACHGIELDGEEQRRRWLIKSLLVREGLSLPDYRARFASEALDDFGPELAALLEHGLIAQTTPHALTPTPRGFEWADAIAPWLTSAAVREASREFELR